MCTTSGLRLKRAYEPASPSDGLRLLTERLWPRGVTRAEAHLDGWLKELAPSAELRRWFGHDPARWEDFRQRYGAELAAPDKRELLDRLADDARRGPVTLVFAARDTLHNAAVVLKDVIERRDRST